MKDEQSRITFNVDPEVKKQAKIAALEKGINLTEYFTDLLLKDLKKEKKI